jgi:hypothetical protein
MTTKQALERFYFERFARTGFLPEGIPEYGDKPDVLWKGERTIGIEITRLHVKSGRLEESEQRQRPLREAVVSGAQKLFRASDGRGIELHVTFEPKHPITPIRRKELPRQLAALARSIDKDGGGQVDCGLLENIPEICRVFWIPAALRMARISPIAM